MINKKGNYLRLFNGLIMGLDRSPLQQLANARALRENKPFCRFARWSCVSRKNNGNGGRDKNANIISELKKFFIQKSLKVADTRYI